MPSQQLSKNELEALGKSVPADAHAWGIVKNNKLSAFAMWRPLGWDSDMLQLSTGAISDVWAEGDYTTRHKRIMSVLNGCISHAEREAVRFLSLRLPESTETLAALHAAESVGFRVIETYVTLARSTNDVPAGDSRIRLSRPEDMEATADLAYRAFEYSRYISDPHIDEHRARFSRAEWVRNGFKGRSEAIYIAENNGAIAGFLLLKSRDNGKVGVIDLIAVDPAHAGVGLGSALVAESIRHYAEKTDTVEVGSQGKNIAAINLYSRRGFSLTKTEITLHRHKQ